MALRLLPSCVAVPSKPKPLGAFCSMHFPRSSISFQSLSFAANLQGSPFTRGEFRFSLLCRFFAIPSVPTRSYHVWWCILRRIPDFLRSAPRLSLMLSYGRSFYFSCYAPGALCSRGITVAPRRIAVVCAAGSGKKPDSAAKRARQAEKRRIYNKARKSEMRTRMKKV